MKILILGGYGTFGGRLAQLLADESRLTLVIAGRSRAKAEAFCAELPSADAKMAAVFDREGDVEAQLQAIAPDVVVDATGPFQDYSGDPYCVVRAAIALGINYLDLADGMAFVKGVAQFDNAARDKGVFVLSGVSSFPVLTAAVVRRLGHDMARVETVIGGIAPSPYANVGLNVIRALAGYAGKPVTLLRGGKPATGYALVDTINYTVAPPGKLPLRRIRFSLVEVPDLVVLPQLWPSIRTVWMGAGPVPEIWHRALNALAWLVRLRILPSLAPLAPLMYRTMHWLSWGEHRGGMFIAVEGTRADGSKVARSWHMLAEREDGPLIPSMAAEAIIRHCLDGRTPVSGARAAATDLELADYEALFARKRITAGVREAPPPGARLPLYRRILGEAYEQMPPSLQAMHDLDDTLTAEGMASVERGKGLLSRLVAWLIGFPPAGEHVPVTVSFRADGGREIWRRRFGEREFESVQEEGRGRSEHLICERFGPLTLAMAFVRGEGNDVGRMRLVLRRWSAFGIPLPIFLAPRTDAYEFAEDGRFNFHVEISHPLTGLIVRYRGWLVPNAGLVRS
jgi:Domain of unknown function (DUF4166)/Saccharopine dehydrogenase NADP binding domain